MEITGVEQPIHAPGPMSGLRRIASSAWGLLLDVLYPPRCGGCDRRGTLMCEDCYSQVTPPYYQDRVEGIDVIASAGSFKGPLRQAIHKLKYESDTPLAKPLTRLLSEALALDDPWAVLDGNPPVIMPVPLHRHREHVRGFNQSVLLARGLSQITGWKLQEGLARVRETAPQVGLNEEQRLRNVASAFTWEGGEIKSPILLVDDVCTTGATLSECAAALRAGGATQVYALTVAKAVGSDLV